MTRRYEETSPWITFQFSVTMDVLWAKLGEAFSKNQHLAGSPLQPGLARELAAFIMVRGALATTAIEGNTLTEDEAQAILLEGKKLPPSQEYLEQEIRNIQAALMEIDASGRDGNTFVLTPEWLREQNRIVLKDLELEEHVTPGEYSLANLVVGNVYKAPPREDVEYLMDRFCEWLNRDFIVPSQDQSLPDDVRFYQAFFGAVLGHLYLAWIHPFGDGNGRTARLLEVATLAHCGVVPWVASNLLSDHYNKTRTRYYRRLNEASKNRDVAGFVRYAAEGYVDQLREQIATVRESQMRVAWVNYVHDQMKEETSGKAKDRRRELALALPADKWTPRREIRTLTPTLAAAYAGASDKMVSRDLSALHELGLVRVQARAAQPCSDIINAFRPL